MNGCSSFVSPRDLCQCFERSNVILSDFAMTLITGGSQDLLLAMSFQKRSE